MCVYIYVCVYICVCLYMCVCVYIYMGFLHSLVGKEFACNAGDPSLIPWLERSPGEGIGYPLQYSWASLVLRWYRICLQCGRPGFSPWVGKIPWRRERLLTPVFWPGEFHGLYSPWGLKEQDMTESLSLHLMSVYIYMSCICITLHIYS